MSCPASTSALSATAAKGGVPMKTLRSAPICACSHRGVGRGLFCFQQLAQDDVALERGEVVDEQHAVEMVDLVLQAGGEQALRRDLPLLVLMVEIAHAAGSRP